MDNATWAMLNETEKELLRDAEPHGLGKLDEDELLALHDRIRRARNKYSKLYRRRAGEQVESDSARAKASGQHARTRRKAEAFEDALARVSRSLATAAKASAATLKAERLAAARGETAVSPAPRAKRTGSGKVGVGKVGAADAKIKRTTPATAKKRASTKAQGARSQAKTDGR